jgi:hypothetical protein
MEFSIDNSIKKSLAESALQNIEMDYYREVIYLGFDPDSFDIEKLRSDDNPNSEVHYSRLFELHLRAESIKAVISSLS